MVVVTIVLTVVVIRVIVVIVVMIVMLVIPIILVMVVILRIAIMVIGGPDPGSSIQTSRSQRCLHPSDKEMRVAVVRAT